MIIDIHSHVLAWPKLIPYNQPGCSVFPSAEDTIKLMDELGIDKSVILPINCSETPLEHQSAGEVLYICEQYPGRFIPFCNVDPRLPKRPDQATTDDARFILAQYKELGFKGLGEMTARIWWDDPLWLNMMQACQDVGFPITFHTITEDVSSYGLIDDIGLPRLEQALQKFPELVFFGHSQGFWSEVGGDLTLEEKNGYPKGPVKPGGKVPELMRKHRTLYGDLSAGSGLNAISRDPAFGYEFIDEFQDQLLFGLDVCSPGVHGGHLQWFQTALDEKHISQQVFDKIMYQNAVRVLNL